MTTENTPADSAQTGSSAPSPASAQQPTAGIAGAKDEGVDDAVTGAESAPPAAMTPAEGATAGDSSAEPATADAGEPTPRRVRLNPTVAPDQVRPIPSVRQSDPQPASPPAGADAPDAVESSQNSAATLAPPADNADAGLSTADVQGSAPATTDQETDRTSAPPPATTDPVELPGRNEALDADLEAELEAAMAGGESPQTPTSESVDAAGEAQTAEAPLAPDAEVPKGTRLTGTVASIHGDDMFLDFGLRTAGVLSRRQFGLRKQPMQGETLEVVVNRVDEKEGLMHVNLPTGTSKVRGEWDALSVDQNVECMVTGTNKGGLEVSIGILRGFMPASQVELGFVPDLNVYVGQKLNARIAEINPKRRKLVLSRRALLEEEREISQKELFEKIEPGQQYDGRVRTLKDYGAFVDIGGADGLLHVAQISWSRINHPSEVLKEGEVIKVQVLSVDKEKKKISLGMRQLTQNPWTAAESRFAQGTTVKGKVTRIETFGAFVELDEGVEGLVHISELDHKRVNKVGEVLRVGQEVDVQVLEVDQKRKRVSLSLKALKEKPEDPREKAESAPIKRQRSVDTLVGGTGDSTGGNLFGDPSKFGG